MSKNYKDFKYFENRPEIVKIFDDLDAYHNFCRIELIEFNEAHLYNRESWQWRNYEKSLRQKGIDPRDKRPAYNGHRTKKYGKHFSR